VLRPLGSGEVCTDHLTLVSAPENTAGVASAVAAYLTNDDEWDRLELPAVTKTSGSRGLPIYFPLPPGTPYDVGQMLAHLVAAMVTEKHPRVATIERWVRKRPRGTVYVDYLQNILGKTLATAYSARASDFAGVSTPLTWDEVAHGVDPREFTIRAAPARFREVGDLWAPLRTGKPVDLERVLHRARR